MSVQLRSTLELGEEIVTRREELCACWADLAKQQRGGEEWRFLSDSFAVHVPVFLDAVAAALRGDQAWQHSDGPAMIAAGRVGSSMAAATDHRLLWGYGLLLDAVARLLREAGPADAHDTGRERPPSELLAPARHVVWSLASASVETILKGTPARVAEGGAAASSPAAGNDALEELRHGLRNCLNKMTLTVALLRTAFGETVADADVVEDLKEEIRRMARLIDTI